MTEQGNSVPPITSVKEVDKSATAKNKKLIILLLGLVIIGLLSAVVVILYSNEIIEKLNPDDTENLVPSRNEPVLPTPTTVITDRQQILNAFAKLEDSTSLKYFVTGSDGDELSFVREYTVDFEQEKEKSTHKENPIYGTGTYSYSEYIIDGKIYLQENSGKITKIEARRAPHSLDDISENLNAYLNDSGYRMTSTRSEKEYEGQPAYYLKLDYSKISDTSSIWIKFKVFADVVLEEYTIEAYITLDGELLELVIPNVYSQVTYRFLETNKEYDISLPVYSL